MSKHTIEISDGDNKSFKVVLSIGYIGNSIGNWRTLDKGFIRFNNGRAEFQNAAQAQGLVPMAEMTVRNVLFFEDSQSPNYGLRLNDYIDVFGVNNQGMGYLWQAWTISSKPARISWVLAD